MALHPNEKHYLREEVKKTLLIYAAVIAITLCWIGMIFAAPWSLVTGHTDLALSLYRGFSSVCHQIPGRSYHFLGAKLGICSRCLGIYFGFAIGLLLYPIFRSLRQTAFPRNRWLFTAAVPVTIDFSLGYLRLWENSFFSRTMTGLIFGIAIAFYILPGLVATFTGDRPDRRPRNAVFNG